MKKISMDVTYGFYLKLKLKKKYYYYYFLKNNYLACPAKFLIINWQMVSSYFQLYF